MINIIIRFIFGYITVSVKGGIEKFLDRLLGSGFTVWNIKKNTDGTVSFCMYKRKFKKLHKITRGCHVRVHILKRHGISHVLRNYRKRYGLIVGVILFFALFYTFSLFIWNIEIVGYDKVTKEEITQRLSENGFEIGKQINKLNIKEIENGFLKGNNEISWISINLKGTTAYVEIRETDEKPEFINSNQPCSIYASRDGVIASVEAYMGYSVVKPGDTVTAGDLMVTGEYTNKYGDEYKLHSYAKVMAYTVHTHSVTIPFNSVAHVKTGKVKNKYSLKLIRFNIPLYFNKKIMYNNYDITESEKKLKFGNNFVLPVSIIKKTYTEVEECIQKKSVESAIADAYEQLRNYEYDLLGVVVNNREYKEEITDDGVTVKVYLECYEDIGIPMKID